MRLDSAVTIPASTGAATGNIDAPAHVVEAGTIGNIPLQNPDGSSPFMHSGTGWIAFNNSAFSGGQDPQSFTAVAQSDIDSAISSLVNRLTPGTQQSVQAQVLSHERSLGQPQCSHQVSSNYRAGDQASSLTVTGTVTCALETYDYNGALALATHLLEMQAEQIPGPSYALGGTVVSTLTQVQLADAKTGTITLTVKSAGIWVFRFSQTQQQTLKTAIAGKRQADALSYLQSQPGVQAAAIQIGQGDNATLPTDTSSIQIVIQPAQNPQATPASTGAAGS